MYDKVIHKSFDLIRRNKENTSTTNSDSVELASIALSVDAALSAVTRMIGYLRWPKLVQS